MHPYTKALLSAVPVPDPQRRSAARADPAHRATCPSPINPPSGCRFHTRCWKAQEICKTARSRRWSSSRPGHQVACHFPENAPAQAQKAAETPADAPA